MALRVSAFCCQLHATTRGGYRLTFNSYTRQHVGATGLLSTATRDNTCRLPVYCQRHYNGFLSLGTRFDTFTIFLSAATRFNTCTGFLSKATRCNTYTGFLSAATRDNTYTGFLSAATRDFSVSAATSYKYRISVGKRTQLHVWTFARFSAVTDFTLGSYQVQHTCRFSDTTACHNTCVDFLSTATNNNRCTAFSCLQLSNLFVLLYFVYVKV